MSEPDHSLIAEFNARRSEAAFAALVRQHVGLVFATALRQVGDAGAAEEITQNVFVALAQAAGKLGSHPTIAGWLHQTALNKSREWLRSELRRRRREQVAVNLDLARAEGDSVWSPLVPLLDEALLELREPDRLAVILHFMEGQTFQEVGSVLGVGEDAARKRVHRCLDQLTRFFHRRGFAVPALAADAPLFTLSSHAASARLAASATTAGLAAAHSAAPASTLTLIKGALKIMAWTKMKTAVVVGTCVLLAAGTATITLCVADKPVHIQGVPKDWSMLSGSREQWSWDNNTINGHSTNGDSILASTRQYGNVTLSAMVSTTNREASLALRMQDADNGYIAAFVPDGTPAAKGDTSKITLLKRKSGEEREIAIFKRRGLSAPGQLEKFTFTANGSRLEIRLNDVTIIKTNDTAFTSGFIGLRVYGDPTIPCDGTFSNLTIY